jgi:hypothetical protein
MGNSNRKISITAEIKAALVGMDKVVNELETGLKEKKIDVSKNSGFVKMLNDYKAAFKEF